MNKQLLKLAIIGLFAVTILCQDASASILSASMKNPPQATADLLTLNNTSGTHLWWVSSTGKMFAASNADFHSSTTVFDSSSIEIRNPASTFAYTLTGGAIGANRTLNLPVVTGTDTLATLGLAQTFTGSITMSGATIALNSNQLFFDGGTNYYMAKSGSAIIVVVGGSTVLTLNSASPFFQFSEGTTGGGSAALGANSPAVTVANPYVWWKVKTNDGSTGYIPVWK